MDKKVISIRTKDQVCKQADRVKGLQGLLDKAVD